MRHGFLLIDKPVGPTSHDSVQVVRNRLHERSVGHLGTLDPQASGLLVLAVGAKALKVLEFFMGAEKQYIADITFGSISTTYDRDGVIEEVTRKPGVQTPDIMQIRMLLEERFTGAISQVPPAHSAIHIGGKRAYQLARQGSLVELPARSVQIHACIIEAFEYPHLQLRITCSSGTYIRSLAHDLGQMLRCGGYLSGLRRTKVGTWNVEDAVQPDQADWTDVAPLKETLTRLPGLEITADEWEEIRHGRTIERSAKNDTIAWFEGLPVAVLVTTEKGTRPRKVL